MATTSPMSTAVLDSSVDAAANRVDPTPKGRQQTYAQILKSTALIGGSTATNLAFGVVRNKVMALLLGPSGVGLMGMYSSVSDLTVNIAGMGVQSSGVREIA